MTLDPEELSTQGPVVRDKRRIDPQTGQLREPQPAAAPGGSGSAGTSTGGAPTGAAPRPGDSPADGAAAELEVALAERTADLQRLQAEYLNYKRRVDRERENARSAGVANTLTSLLPVLDDIGRARDHGELTGGFKAVAESFERTVDKLGLVAFGEAGDPFDPRIHEALMHSYADDVDGPVCQAILQVGYQLGDKVLRPARVAVAEPPHDAETVDQQSPAEPTGGPADGGGSQPADGSAGGQQSPYGDDSDATASEGDDR